MSAPGPLTGRRVLVTRRGPGELAELLAQRGAIAVHVPLIDVVEPLDGGRSLSAALATLADGDWVVVTSPAGAERVHEVAEHPGVRLAAVGESTARALTAVAGRSVDVVPTTQRADALVAAVLERTRGRRCRFVVAQADIASPDLVDALRAAGHEVDACVAYRTVLVRPDPEALRDADALLLASGSAARSWVEAVGTATPSVVVAIGPSTAAAARDVGLKIDGVATDHSLAGLVHELEHQFSERDVEPPGNGWSAASNP